MTSEKIERTAFGIKILKNNHPDIRRIRNASDTPSIHGNKFWKSSFLLMDYLREFPPNKKAKILEIGCGWGLAGIFCAKEFSATVTSLDADSAVFPYLEHHARINEVKSKTWRCRYENVRKQDVAKFDLVIGADICFWDSMVKPLYNLTRRAAKAGVRVVITDPGRPTFREVAERTVDKLDANYDNWMTTHPLKATGLVVDVKK